MAERRDFTLMEQIAAVEWAVIQVDAARLSERAKADLRAALEAAAETLRTLEFGRETMG